jgi:uncharacterized protein YecE (DUF72 family)
VSTQLDLFGKPPPKPEVRPAAVSAELATAASKLPPHIRLGTSSWSFPGWAGLVYDGVVPQARLVRSGLAAYAAHPLLRAVGIDRTYYGPLAAADFAAYAAVVPDHFRFLVKAHELCTIARFPSHERYGAQRGQANGFFLDAAYAADAVVGPAVEGLGDRLGPLLFQFPPQDVAAMGGPDRFAARLRGFLRGLPAGPTYAVEIRSAELLRPAYLDALGDSGAHHCVNAHPTMPDVDAQARLALAANPRALVVRWMLHRGFAYEAARERYAPFDRLIDEDAMTREQIARLCRSASVPSFVIINNKAEGSAPLSAFRLAARIVELA